MMRVPLYFTKNVSLKTNASSLYTIFKFCNYLSIIFHIKRIMSSYLLCQDDEKNIILTSTASTPEHWQLGHKSLVFFGTFDLVAFIKQHNNNISKGNTYILLGTEYLPLFSCCYWYYYYYFLWSRNDEHRESKETCGCHKMSTFILNKMYVFCVETKVQAICFLCWWC